MAIVLGAIFIGGDAFAHAGGSAWVGGAAVVLGLVLGAVLVRRERSKARPLIPLDLMRGRVFALSVIASVCAFSAYMLAFLALPFHFEFALHRSQVETGLLMTPWPVALGIAAPLAGRMSDRVSAALLGAVGMGVLGCGLVLLTLLPPGATNPDIAWRLAAWASGCSRLRTTAPCSRRLLESGRAPPEACSPRRG